MPTASCEVVQLPRLPRYHMDRWLGKRSSLLRGNYFLMQMLGDFPLKRTRMPTPKPTESSSAASKARADLEFAKERSGGIRADDCARSVGELSIVGEGSRGGAKLAGSAAGEVFDTRRIWL